MTSERFASFLAGAAKALRLCPNLGLMAWRKSPFLAANVSAGRGHVFEVTPTFVNVHAGRITARTPFPNLLLCERVPNTTWDRARHLWTYPAKPQHAPQILSSIPRLSGTETSNELVARQAKPPAAAVPAPKLTEHGAQEAEGIERIRRAVTKHGDTRSRPRRNERIIGNCCEIAGICWRVCHAAGR
jgi:hypothetical protein